MHVFKAAMYAFLSASYVARSGNRGPIQGRVIAAENGTPIEYLLKVLQSIVRGQIMRSDTGRRGGYTLRRPPRNIRLVDIIEAADGPLAAKLPATAWPESSRDVVDRLRMISESILQFGHQLYSERSLETLITTDAA
ncbi:MAG: RrF2 family transcriptional regulator [Phycisphaerae bacterium]